MDLDHVSMLPEVQVRRGFNGAPIDLAVLRPPYPAVGCGVLRVLRVKEVAGRFEVVAGYESYERLPH